ncbi:MAG: hypothetical protein ACRDJ4_11495 [Actinomycetota bacterium]
MRCPHCNALNPEAADWCSQCLTRFPSPAPPSGSGNGVGDGSGTLPPARLRPPAAVDPGGGRGPADPFHDAAFLDLAERSEHLLEAEQDATWRCRACGTPNALSLDRCSACGRSMFESFGAAREASSVAPRSPQTAALLSIIPGLGHFYLNRPAEGFSRLLSFLWWLGVALMLAARPLLPLRAIFIVAVLALVAVSVLEAYQQAIDGRPPTILTPRVFLYSWLALLAILFMGFMIAFGAARRGR